jgi:hypothetical protein
MVTFAALRPNGISKDMHMIEIEVDDRLHA